MRRTIRALALVMALCVPALAGPLKGARADGPAVITVTGEISKANRGSFDPFTDALFEALGETFDVAYAFTLEELLALPQHTIEVKYPNWPRAVKVSGPRLDAVLDAAGAKGSDVMAQAVDGYAPAFKMSEVRKGRFILGLVADGEPLSMGGRGPAWLVFPPHSYEGQTGADDAGLSWAVFHIKVAAAE